MTTKLEQPQTRPLGWWGTRWLRVALAVTFLTRLPLPIRGDVSSADLRASMGWYPLIGLGLGAVGWGSYAGLSALLPATPMASALAAAVTIILLEMLTGALHLDGFMDTCDGLGSGTPRERALEIMKDSRVGAMGVFGAVGVLLVKVTALATLPVAGSLMPLLVGWTAARLLPILGVTLFRYARAQGTGGAFAEGRAPWALAFAAASTLAVIGLVNPKTGFVLTVLAVTLTLLVQVGIAKKLGGLTGDVYGMGIELTEALTLLLACMAPRW